VLLQDQATIRAATGRRASIATYIHRITNMAIAWIARVICCLLVLVGHLPENAAAQPAPMDESDCKQGALPTSICSTLTFRCMLHAQLPDSLHICPHVLVGRCTVHPLKLTSCIRSGHCSSNPGHELKVAPVCSTATLASPASIVHFSAHLVSHWSVHTCSRFLLGVSEPSSWTA
jgi:hypothetical protein